MLRYFKPIVAIALTAYLVLHLLSSNLKNKESLTGFQKVILVVTAPGQTLFDHVVDALGGIFNHYILLSQTSKTNEALVQEREKLKSELIRMSDLEAENNRLREILALKLHPKIKMLAAERIATGASPFERTMRVSKGMADGVAEGMAVFHPSGVVGQVWRVSEHWSDILLLADAASAIDVMSLRSRARAILRGGQLRELHFEYVFKGEDIKVGDEIISSGLDGVYPAGFPVGVVRSIEPQTRGLFYEGTVAPKVEFTRLEEVLIVTGEER